MPQKRNPDVFEIMRGKMNLIQTLPGQIAMIVSNLPSGYNRELQLLKQMIFNAFGEIQESISAMYIMLDNIIVREDITDNPLYNPIFSTEEANRLAKGGMPFRDAYKEVAKMVKEGKSFRKTSLDEYSHEVVWEICATIRYHLFSKSVLAVLKAERHMK